MVDRDQLLNDPETATRAALDGRQSTLWTAMPAIVSSVDLTAMTIEAQPTIQGVVTNQAGIDQYVNMPLLLDVPICFPSAGGFSLTLPIAIGDEVLIVIASRCIDSWWQLGGIGIPIEARMHDLSDGFAIPGPRSQPRVIGNISSTNAQLRNDAGTVYLEITPSGEINLVAPSGIMLTTPTATFTGAVVIDGAMTVGGGASISGGVDVISGAIAAPEAVIDGITFTSHVHSGVTTGGGDTGAPV
jgi:hypothetical protein